MRGIKTWWLIILPGLILMILFFVLPLILLFRYSFYEFVPGQFMQPGWVIEAYKGIFHNPTYFEALKNTIWIGIKVVIFCALLGYPVAYFLARKQFMFRQFVSLLVIIPLLTSPVVTAFGWVVLISDNGLVNQILINTGLIHSPLKMMFNETGVVIALIQYSLPFMILSLRSTLVSLDTTLEDAASSLGASPFRAFVRVVLPLSMPGVFAGSLLVFINTISAFVTPMLLGGGRVHTLAGLIYDETMVTLNWPVAAAASIILLLITMALLWGYSRLMESRLLGGGGRS
ncbi:ABC transporter permease [Paenibacillus terreus]|uniref:ABC transporter permease n=1 Tax=Paenibacillus terreus TaxID=1387834 RepID=A0ABV5B872_9BACL